MNEIANLSRREREIMEIVFALGEGTVSQILERMSDAPTRPALRSLLTILESKGHLRHRKSGREFVYLPVQSRQKVGQRTFGQVLKTFFGGSLSQALASYLSDPRTEFTDEEIRELNAVVEKAAAQRAHDKNRKTRK